MFLPLIPCIISPTSPDKTNIIILVKGKDSLLLINLNFYLFIIIIKFSGGWVLLYRVQMDSIFPCVAYFLSGHVFSKSCILDM